MRAEEYFKMPAPDATFLNAGTLNPMDREQRFLAALGAVTGFAIGADGSLELKSGERVLMRARRK